MMPLYVLVFLVALMGYFVMFNPLTNNQTLDINEARSVAMAVATQHEVILKGVDTAVARPSGYICLCPYFIPNPPTVNVAWDNNCPTTDSSYAFTFPASSSLTARPPMRTMSGVVTSLGCRVATGELILATWVDPAVFKKADPAKIAEAIGEIGSWGAGDGIAQNDTVISNNRYWNANGISPSPAFPLPSGMIPNGVPVKATLVKDYE